VVQVLIGDLFSSKAQTLVNTVNCVGVMGKGVALEAKKRFPDMYEDYVARCEFHEVRLGEPYLYRRPTPPWILNFPTKDHWRSVTKLDDIVRGLEHLIAHYREWEIKSLAVPPLGCGNGQLEWRIVGPTLYRYLDRLEIPVELYAPYGTPHEELLPGFFGRPQALEVVHSTMPDPQWIRPEWVAVVEILKQIEDQPYHWPIGRTVFQKVSYVATRQGLDTDLVFERNSYGPYSPQLKGLESRLANNGLIRVNRTGNRQDVAIGPTYQAAREAYGHSLAKWEPIIVRTVDLFMRVNAHQAEVMATVMFVTDELSASGKGMPSERQVLDSVMDWKRRRKPEFREEEVAKSIRNLAMLGWVKVVPSPGLPVSDDPDSAEILPASLQGDRLTEPIQLHLGVFQD